jgi:FkbM family methyltransferase
LGGLLGLERSHGHVLDQLGPLRVEYSLDSLIGQLLYLHGGFEEAEAHFLASRLRSRPGAVFLDVGANIGLHSLRAAALDNVAAIFAFEPGRETFAMLERNIARNGLEGKIHALALAVGATIGRAQFHFCADDAYSSLKPDQRRPVRQIYEVAVTTVDEWARAQAPVRLDLIKIDVEGSEAEVIAGARQTLARHQPELMVEIYQGAREGFSAEGLVREICALGYDAFVLVDGKPVGFVRHDDTHFNYHFLPRAGSTPS